MATANTKLLLAIYELIEEVKLTNILLQHILQHIGSELSEAQQLEHDKKILQFGQLKCDGSENGDDN